MKQFTLLFFSGIILSLFILGGCKDDDEIITPSAFGISTGELTVAIGADEHVTLSGGKTPYSIQIETDTTIAEVELEGSTLHIQGIAGGYTTLTVNDADGATAVVNVNVSGAITYELFPILAGHQYVYSGYAISNSTGTPLSDPTNAYRTSWLIGGAHPLITGSTIIVDSTTLQHPSAGIITVARNLVIIKNPGTGEVIFSQTLGPFFRAFNIARTDTVRFVSIAKPALGIGGEWTALDSTYTGGSGEAVRLQIFGQVLTGETITDSSSAHAKHKAIRFRTWRRITVNSTVVVDNSTTSRIWLVKDIGPAIIHIAQDTENLGHFRVLKSKNF